MLTSISPVGEHGRGQRWPVTVGAYALGSTAGGAAMGTILGALGQTLGRWMSASTSLLLLAAVAVVGLLLDSGALRRGLPSWHRQVDEDWLARYRGWVYGAGFGFQLGLGVVTIVASSLVYVVLGAALLSRSWTAGLAIGAVFGLVRALPLVATRRVVTTDALGRLHRRLHDAAAPAARVGQAVQVAAVAAVAASVGLLA